MAKSIFDPSAYKGPSMIDMAPEVKFRSWWEWALFWAANIWLLWQVGEIFRFPVFDWLIEMVKGWLW